MEFYKSESDTRPEEIDFTSSPTTVYVRKNITVVPYDDSDSDERRIKYVYDEMKVSKTDYIATLHERQEQTDDALQELILATFGGD